MTTTDTRREFFPCEVCASSPAVTRAQLVSAWVCQDCAEGEPGAEGPRYCHPVELVCGGCGEVRSLHNADHVDDEVPVWRTNPETDVPLACTRGARLAQWLHPVTMDAAQPKGGAS